MTNKFKKYISIILIVFLTLNTPLPGISFAEEPTPTPTETTVDNSATTSNSTDTSSNTGDNSINPTPTPTPEETTTTEQTSEDTQTDPNTTSTSEPTPTPTITEDQAITSENSAEITNDISSQSNTGENTIATSSAALEETSSGTEEEQPSSEISSQEGGSINTGDATSVTSLLNNINTTNVNAKVINQTINIFVNEKGNINLSDPFIIAAEAIQNHPEDPVINVSVTNVNNYAYLSNDVVSFANTGGNSINGADALINTGNAYSVVSLLNNVNFTVVDSNIHVVVVNIFGNLNGNIILPNFGESQSTNCSGCGISLTVNNNANVSNSVDSIANTGENNINGSGSIETGNATSIVNNLNIVNMNILGVNAQVLYINNLGVWNGNFIGWDMFDPQTGGASLIFYSLNPTNEGGNGCPSCAGDLNINNSAYVFNNISSLANTGENSTNGTNGSVTTGNAYSAVSLTNFINTNFINSLGFFGFINIFGNWTGDIGGKAEFDALETGNQEDDNQETDSSNPQQNDIREQGGLLDITQTNNVGDYVLPGDTVTFFVKVKNPGIGKVYETKLDLYLIKDGKIAGGTTFDLGAIPAGRAVNLTTGFVLSKNAPGGHYTARAYAWGQVGPNNDKIEATGDSEFDIFGTQNLAQSLGGGGLNNKPPKSVLGTNANSQQASIARQAEKLLYLSVLMLTIFTYIFIRLIRKKELVMAIISSNSFKEKLYSLRMFLL